MIITTTNSVEGLEITAYLGIVTGEAVSGINMFKDIGAGLRNVFGGRSAGYEEELQRAREEVLAEMSQRAEALGADAVVGASIGYETFEGMVMTCCSGTAVKLARRG
ncbi:YbjQ family protein [Thermophilibacter sp.]